MASGTGMLPVVLLPQGRRVVVMGGGRVARRKVARLLAAGAAVTVVAPEIDEELAEWGRRGRVECRYERYSAGRLPEGWMVIAATDDGELNRGIVERCREEGVLCAAVDENWRRGDFTMPAVRQRGDVTIAVSTGGRSPRRAREIAERLADRLEDDDGK